MRPPRANLKRIESAPKSLYQISQIALNSSLVFMLQTSSHTQFSYHHIRFGDNTENVAAVDKGLAYGCFRVSLGPHYQNKNIKG